MPTCRLALIQAKLMLPFGFEMASIGPNPLAVVVVNSVGEWLTKTR